MKPKSLTFAALAWVVLAGCQQKDSVDMDVHKTVEAPATDKVTVTITYRERMALSPEAVLEISLEDISRAGAAAKELSRVKIKGPGQVPIPFTLEYNPSDIDNRMTYAVRASITDRGRLMFTTDTVTPVLTHGAGSDVELVLVRVAGEPSAGMELEGMFRYMADAALFRDCRDGKSYPVAMEGQYQELERAYLNSGIEPGAEVMFSLKGRLLSRPSMEGNNNEISLIVDSFNQLYPDKSCAPTTHADLVGTYWRLDELNGSTVNTPESMKEANMVLTSEDPGVHGFGGCNKFFGQFETDGDALTFSSMGSTMMACPAGMDTEHDFLAALGETTRYQISGLFLELYAGDQLLARLEAVYL